VEVQEIEIDKIFIEDRFRTELGDIDELARSIKEKGLIQPITVSSSLRLLAGGRRLEASKRLGLTTIAAVVRATEGEIDEKEIELYENIHRKDLTWQERATLEKAIYDLKPTNTVRGVAENLGIGKSTLSDRLVLADAITKIPQLRGMKTELDAWKALKKMQESIVVAEITKRAAAQAEQLKDEDLPPELAAFKDAAASYMVGDALMGMDNLPGGTNFYFDFAEVDPPYGIDLTVIKRAASEVKATEGYVEEATAGYAEFLHEAMSGVHALLKEDTFCIWWFGHSHYQVVLESLRRVGFSVNAVPAIWAKGNQGQTNQPNIHLAHCYETFFVARKGNPVLMKPGRSNVFAFDPVAGQKKIHPTERPIELILELLQTFTVPGARILCPFLGSGNTLRAAKKLNMVGLGWDKEASFRNQFLMRVKEDSESALV